MMKKLYFIVLITIFAGCSGQAPSTLGVTSGKFSPCPSSPNCVSTQADDAEHKMDPIPFTGTILEAKAKLKKVVKNYIRTEIISETNEYMHVEFTSFTFRFVDDVEFFFDASNKLIHFRSASRKGYSDLGANKKRMTKIIDKFKE